MAKEIDLGRDASWNSAQETARRLSFWVEKCNEYSFGDEHLNFFKGLKIFFKEVWGHLTSDEKNELKKDFDEIKKEVKVFNTEVKKFDEDEEITFSSKLPEMLDDFDFKLRDYAGRHDLFNPSKKTIYDLEDDE